MMVKLNMRWNLACLSRKMHESLCSPASCPNMFDVLAYWWNAWVQYILGSQEAAFTVQRNESDHAAGGAGVHFKVGVQGLNLKFQIWGWDSGSSQTCTMWQSSWPELNFWTQPLYSRRQQQEVRKWYVQRPETQPEDVFQSNIGSLCVIYCAPSCEPIFDTVWKLWHVLQALLAISVI